MTNLPFWKKETISETVTILLDNFEIMIVPLYTVIHSNMDYIVM